MHVSDRMSVSTNIRIQIVLLMAKFDSPTVVRRKLQVDFGTQTPSEYCIKDTFQRFCETGSVEDRPRSGRPTVITEEKIEEVRDFCENTPGSSVRSVAQECSISPTTSYRIMREHLSLKPYKAQFVQQLYEEDFQDRVEMCQTLIQLLTNNNNRGNIFFSDEAAFHLSGLVNKHNVRYWCTSNPHLTIETAMESPKLNVWCAMSETHLIGPFFFNEDTVNGKNYLSMLREFFVPAMKRLRKHNSMIFQQDGAPAHFHRDVRQFLDETFPDRWVGRGGAIRWAPRSPDLSPLDFFLWGHIKNNIYKSPIKNLDELKTKIDYEIRMVSKETLRNVFANVVKRMNLCISADGDYFEQLM